jgi:anti-sigma regulatory factor (Ser/Thr protein kinase)
MVPGPNASTEQLSLDPVPASVSTARKFVSEVLGPVDEDVRDTALLLASELVTNAILHAHTPVQVEILVDDEHALVCVADRLPGVVLAARDRSHDRRGGRGLALVADLSEQWGTTDVAGGKTVWFTLPLALAASSPAGTG